MALSDLLANCYLNDQPWQNEYISHEKAVNYFEEMINRSNIIAIVDKEELLGYVEFHRINFEQLGRIVCKHRFFNLDENTTDGNIAYIANIWIKKESRRSMVFKYIETLFFKINSSAEYFCGTRIQRSNHAMRVFKKKDIKNELLIGV